MNKVFNKAGLRKFWFPVYKMPKNGSDWLTVKKMLRMNHRLIVFTSNATKEASERIAYEWNYVVENKCEFLLFSAKIRLYTVNVNDNFDDFVKLQMEMMEWEEVIVYIEQNHIQ